MRDERTVKQGINLIPSSILVARARRDRLRAWLVADSVLAAAVVGVVAVAHPEASGLIERLRSEHESARSALATAQENLLETVTGLREARAEEAVARRLGARPDFSGLLRTIAMELDDRATLDQVLVAPLAIDPAGQGGAREPSGASGPESERSSAVAPVREQYQVLITGVATSAGIASEFVLRLERSGYFSDVGLSSTSPRDVGEIRAVAFRITGVLGEGRLATVEDRP